MNEAPLSVLIIANPEPTSDWVQSSLKDMNYKLAGRVDTTHQALQLVKRSPIDIILADSTAQGVTELHWIQRLAAESAGTMVIVIAAGTEMEFVRHAMLTGAQGFLLKPFDLTELHKSIQQVHQLSLQLAQTCAVMRLLACSLPCLDNTLVLEPSCERTEDVDERSAFKCIDDC